MSYFFVGKTKGYLGATLKFRISSRRTNGYNFQHFVFHCKKKQTAVRVQL